MSFISKRKWNRVHFFRVEKKPSGNEEHPVYVFARSGNLFKVIPITSNATTDGVKNVKLDHNIDPDIDDDPNNKYPSYAVPYRAPRNMGDFQDAKKKYRIHIDDKPKIDELIGKANKKQKK